jgi:hypothetical protein
VEPGAGIALPEQRFSLGDPLLMHAFRHFGQLFRRQPLKQGDATQKGIDLYRLKIPHALSSTGTMIIANAFGI